MERWPTETATTIAESGCRRLEESVAKNWEEHKRILQAVETLRKSNIRLHEEVQNPVNGIHALIHRIPPESLR